MKEYGPSAAAGTAKFCQYINNFFDSLNVRVPNAIELTDNNGNVINKKRNLFVEPYKNIDDFRFNWLKNDFLKYFEDWMYSIETRSGTFTREQRAKMFIARPTYEGIKITINSTIELTKFLLNAGVPYILTGKFIQDNLENYFAMQRAPGRQKDNPSLYDVGYNDNWIRNAKSFRPIGSNCEESEYVIDGGKLPSKKPKL